MRRAAAAAGLASIVALTTVWSGCPALGLAPHATASPAAAPSSAAHMMAVVVLLAVGAGVYALSLRRARPPRAIGGFARRRPDQEAAPEEKRGIGRFSRPRDHPPRRLI